ncbi:MAG: O-antigen ligase family protein [Bdellovibrionales bacterium]|nr:O-antigen ligase family protein [Bdellovibrionales bacterium]
MNNIFLNMTYFSLLVVAAGSFTSISLLALAHILIVIPAVYFTYKRAKQDGLGTSEWALLGMIVSIILSVWINADIIESPWRNIGKSKYFILALMGTFAYREFFQEKISSKKIKILINTLLITTTIASLSGIVAYYTGYNYIKMKPACSPNRACGLFGMLMTYAYGVSLFLVILTGVIIHKEKCKQWFSMKLVYFVWIINFTGLILTYTRGAWIGFIIGVPLFFFKENKKKFIICFLVLLIGGGLTLTFNKFARSRFLNSKNSDMLRIAFFQSTLYAVKEKPLLGWGYRNFEPNSKMIKEKYNLYDPTYGGHAHNNLLEHLASTGIIGFIFTLLFYITWAREAYLRNDIFGKLLFPFVISFIVSGMVQYTFGDAENLFFIMALYSIFQGTRHTKSLSF